MPVQAKTSCCWLLYPSWRANNSILRAGRHIAQDSFPQTHVWQSCSAPLSDPLFLGGIFKQITKLTVLCSPEDLHERPVPAQTQQRRKADLPRYFFGGSPQVCHARQRLSSPADVKNDCSNSPQPLPARRNPQQEK